MEESIVDILPLLKQRLGNEPAFRHVDGQDQEDISSWEVEWTDEVQKVLEMDAGWGLAVFWDMVLYNIEVSSVRDKGCAQILTFLSVTTGTMPSTAFG